MLSKGKKREIALSRIKELFSQADSIFKKDAKLANRYVQLARKISMRSKVVIPSNLKKRFCKNCYYFLVPGKNVRIRTKNKKVVYYCFNCKHHMRYVIR